MPQQKLPDFWFDQNPNKPINTNKTETMRDYNQNIQYPGFLAIDLGTSNSTVTLHDTKRIIMPRGLPQEQKQKLRNNLEKWLTLEIPKELESIHQQEWSDFIAEITKNLAINPDKLTTSISSSDESLLELIRQIEICLVTKSKQFRRTVGQKIHETYSQVFRVPLMRSRNFFPVELELETKETEIISELKIEIDDNPLKIVMGERARQDRQNDIASAQNPEAWNKIKGRYHHSPKRYFGQDKVFSLYIEEQDENCLIDIPANELIKASYNELIKLTETYRENNASQFAEGYFYTAVVTYPTVASPVVRTELEKIITSLGIKDVQTAYDEAVSVAIFFLWREFGGNLNLGIESFKTRCHYYGNKWAQNVLVIDIGGGTTDIALINLNLEEINPFDQGEERGSGGRYYKLTPKVLGASGHLQLGGELITLSIFLWLKVAIADCLLTAVEAGNLHSESLINLIPSLDEIFLQDGHFVSGSLIKQVDKLNPQFDNNYSKALDAAEKVIPTRWESHSERLQTFYTLWEYAEDAKIQLSNNNGDGIFVFTQEQIEILLDQNTALHYEPIPPNHLAVTLTQAQFQQQIQPIITEAINIAKGLVENRLKEEQQHHHQKAKIDWMILSGKTCNLSQVQAEIYKTFSQSEYFTWNPERITFVPEYTKIATSAGACYAEMLRRLRFDPQESKEILRTGANQLYIDVKNLFYFLPCSFKRDTLTQEPISLFEAGTKLAQLSPHEPLLKARSQWQGIQLSTRVYRQDYDGQSGLFNWGNFNGQEIARSVDIINDDQFLNLISTQFEIDQKLQFKLFLCRGKKPHYQINAQLPSINVASAAKQVYSSFSLGRLWWKVVETTDNNDSLEIGDIAINVQEANAVASPQSYTIIFKAIDSENTNPEIFHYQPEKETKSGQGIISNPLTSFPRSGKHTFYMCVDNSAENVSWERIGELSKIDGIDDSLCQYRATIDDQGIIRIHPGEIPYLVSDDPQCLRTLGTVYITKLELQKNDLDEHRDPFSGKH